MSAIPASFVNPLSEQDYLAGEQQAQVRHEYCEGEVYAMAGSSKRHNTIALNIAFNLRLATQQQPCQVYMSDIKVRVKQGRAYYYPDVLVSCTPEDSSDYYLEQPCLIVEVTSKSTEWKDYHEKLLAYQAIPTLRQYLVVSQDRVYATLFYREPEGTWWMHTYESLTDTVALECPDTPLTLTQIYQGIDFSIPNPNDVA